MTKKHYEAIAGAIKYQREHGQPHNARWEIADLLADYFATDNKNFNRAKFLESCGIESYTRHCHLCDSVQENKYCTNSTCAEYE